MMSGGLRKKSCLGIIWKDKCLYMRVKIMCSISFINIHYIHNVL